MRDRLALAASDRLAALTFPPSPEGWVLVLKWAPTALAGVALLVALVLVLARRTPPGDNPDGRAPLWSRLLQGAFGLGVVQAGTALGVALYQPDAFASSDLLAQTNPRLIVLVVSLFGLAAIIPYRHMSAVLRARGQARMRAPLNVPVIGLLTPVEERICTAYGRASDAARLLGLLSVACAAGVFALYRYRHLPINPWPLAAPFISCLVVCLLILITCRLALRRLNRRSLSVYCLELVAQAQAYLSLGDGEHRREGLVLFQRVADLANQAGKDRLLRDCSAEAQSAIGDARMALAQVALEPGGAGPRAAAEDVAGAAALRDLQGDEWLRLGWLLASAHTPPALAQDRARYGHLLLGYCRAWLREQQQMGQAIPLSLGLLNDERLARIVTALERQVCTLALPTQAGQEAPADAAGASAPWRADAFLAMLAARHDLPLLLALNEGALQLDATVSWARVNAGLCHLAAGDAAQARGYLEVVAAQRPDDPSLTLYYLVALAREQQTNEALLRLEEGVRANAGWFLAVRLYAETLLELAQTGVGAPLTGAGDQPVRPERWASAGALFEHVLTLEPMRAYIQMPAAAPVYLALGMAALVGRAQPAEAEVWFRRVPKVDERLALGWYGLALATWQQGQREEAQVAAREALRRAPQHVPTATLSAQALLESGQMAPALAMANEGLHLLSDPQMAQRRAIRLPPLTPEREVLLHVKGRAAFELGRYEEAFQALDLVLGRATEARFYAACALFQLGRYAEAVARLKEHLASQEGAQDYRALLYLGCALHAQGQNAQSAALYALDTCLQLAPAGSAEQVRALLERGQMHAEREELDQARSDYEAALAVERSPVILYSLAVLSHRQGQDQAACDLLAPIAAQAAPAFAAPSSSRLASMSLGPTQEPIEARIQRFYALLRGRLLAAEQARLAAEQAEQARAAAEEAERARFAAEQAAQAQLAQQALAVAQALFPPGAQASPTEGVPAPAGATIPSLILPPGAVQAPAPQPGNGEALLTQPADLPGDQTLVPGSLALKEQDAALSRAAPADQNVAQAESQD